MLKFEMPKNQSSIIKVIGVGGGGSNAVTHMFKQGIRGVDFVICNTDCQALDTSPVPVKIQLGNKGLGAGSIPSVGKEAATENIDQIRKILEQNTKMVFITAGMGGGTGTGAAPVIATLAKELGILTVGIVTIPFSFEGRKRAQQARAGIDELKKSVDTLLIICNDKLRELEGNLTLSEAFGKADDILTIAAKGIAEIITVTGYVNVDFEDVKTVMKDSGKAIMGSGTASGENRAIDAIQTAMTSPLLDDANIKGASNILLYISSGKDEITLDEVMEITEYIQKEAGSTADIIWGNGSDESLGDKISLTLIATGFDSKIVAQEPVEKTIHILNDSPKPATTEIKNTAREPKPEIPVQKPIEEIRLVTAHLEEKSEEINTPTLIQKQEPAKDQRIFTFEVKQNPPVAQKAQESVNPVVKKQPAGWDFLNTFSTEKSDVELKQEEKGKDRFEKLKEMSLKMNTPNGLTELEKEPAFKRKQVTLNEPTHSSETEVSRYTLFKNENGVEMRQNNSFLHDNVD